MKPKFLIDFETRSTCDLTRRGAHVYAKDPSTVALCLGWIDINDRSNRGMWRGWPGKDAPPAHLFDATIFAWNAAFEQQIWNEVCTRMGWPHKDPDDFVCLMKMSAHAGMPLALDKACPAADLSMAKDMGGHRLMLRWCKPLPLNKAEKAMADPAPRWADDPKEYEALCAYAESDCDAEMGMYDRLHGTISPFEIEIMKLDRKINDRGFQIDVEAATGAAKIASEEVRRLNKAMSLMTNGVITTCNQRQRIIDYALDKGVELDDLKAETVKDALAGDEDKGAETELARDDLPVLVRRVLELRAEANKASVAKLRAMVRGVGADHSFRGGFTYGGAAKTGRWSGRRVQAQNFARDNPPDEVDEVTWFDALATGDREYFSTMLPEGWTVMDGLKASLRGLIIP